MHSRSQGWMSSAKCGGYRLIVSRNDAFCHFKRGILGSFQAGNSLIQCHTYILVPMTYYSHLHVGRKQILKNILWSSTHWSAWNLSSVLHLKGRKSTNIIYTILKKKEEEERTFLPPALELLLYESSVFLPSVCCHTFQVSLGYSLSDPVALFSFKQEY